MMQFIDWIIVAVPLLFIFGIGFYICKNIKGVSDFLAAGRLCGRYMLSVGDVACGLAVVTLIANIEVHYKTGYALNFWSAVMWPLTMLLSLTGYCTYRLRETKAMSLGQFLEMRYGSKTLRIFAAALRSTADVLANVILPALAARFFITFLGLPQRIEIFGWQMPTFFLVIAICLILAVSIICLGGAMAITVTDTLQGLLCFPLLVVFIIFMLSKFSWGNEVVQVLSDRAKGESFINPYDISHLRDFNLFMLIVSLVSTIMTRSSGFGAGASSAAKSAHEQKMAGVLGTWRGFLSNIFYLAIGLGIITFLCHRNFADQARNVRMNISRSIVAEMVPDAAGQQKIMSRFAVIPAENHEIGKDAAFSDRNHPDVQWFKAADEALKDLPDSAKKRQEFRTLFRQLMLPATMRYMLPCGLAGLFCLMMVMFLISTDDSRIYSASLTISQDCILPFCKELTPEQHIRMIRLVSIGVGVLYMLGSLFFAQLDYINLFVAIMWGMWAAGGGPVMIFGLYSRFGTAAGAFASLLSGLFFTVGGVLCQRNWASVIYPWLDKNQLVKPVGQVLSTITKPFNPVIVWEMNPLKFPINSYEIYFLAIVFSILAYCLVSFLTCKTPFNLDRMLHRGIYAIDEQKPQSAWTLKNFYSKFIGITPEYSTGDKCIAWGVFIYTIIYRFIGTFVIVVIWNAVSPWSVKHWGNYFLWIQLIIPAFIAVVTTIWFGIGGFRDLRDFLVSLRTREADHLDNGVVDGEVSLMDKAKFDALENKETSAKEK
ncbi:MAG: sodium:panthothenate symporter [Lentisphaeria bacterium]|nr:sodium:panthothenate symporter [Lentisphaeria bacterium]